MPYIDKPAALMLAQALAAYEITDVFVSPGSRNAPLIAALSRMPGLKVSAIVDERSAAFIAMGNALVSGKPAVLVCTSGSALLNYAPAVAEAFYRKVPLIVVSADRPPQWIGQDDGQTIRQPGALANVVKGSFNLRGEFLHRDDLWNCNRLLNEALQLATSGRLGPVHINVSLDEPLFSDSDSEAPAFRKVELVAPAPVVENEMARELAKIAIDRNVLIVGGFNAPSNRLSRAISRLAALPSVVVAADALTNLRGAVQMVNVNRVTRSKFLRKREKSHPDLLITFGGSLISRDFKEYLRDMPFAEHWHIGENDSLIDSYFSLTRRVEIAPEGFFPRFAGAMEHFHRVNCGIPRAGRNPAAAGEASLYKSLWYEADYDAEEIAAPNRQDGFDEKAAIFKILKALPKQWNLQLSNGLTPRYALLAPGASAFHRCDCNRGVSGIDGSVSTALGASLPFSGTTVLITGDMSMQYDIAALSSALLSPRLKIVVINNGGGGIFRKISATRSLIETEQYLTGDIRLPLKELAAGYGLEYFRADSPAALSQALTGFVGEQRRPAILEVVCGSTE